MINKDEYKNFVWGLLAPYAQDVDLFKRTIDDIVFDEPVAVLCNAIGLTSESGEALDVVKKLYFHGRELDETLVEKLKDELGDVMFYLTNLCTALGTTPEEMMQRNYDKLSKRYPGGQFNVQASIKKADGT